MKKVKTKGSVSYSFVQKALEVNEMIGTVCIDEMTSIIEHTKRNTELLRKTLPQEFIDDIRSVKQIHYKHKDFDVKLKLGGDLMNAVYVFGLPGFSSNYPCVFCTQHKDDLHITKETACDKVVTTGKGKNKVTKTIKISGTSYHDVTKLTRSLEEQKHCLHNGKEESGIALQEDDEELGSFLSSFTPTI
ncbi:unnamed protein product, partial [Didymodactylos carnosus]